MAGSVLRYSGVTVCHQRSSGGLDQDSGLFYQGGWSTEPRGTPWLTGTRVELESLMVRYDSLGL